MAYRFFSFVAICFVSFQSSDSRSVPQTEELFPWNFSSLWAPKWGSGPDAFCLDGTPPEDIVCEFGNLGEFERLKREEHVTVEVGFHYTPTSGAECSLFYTTEDREASFRLAYSRSTCETDKMSGVRVADMNRMDFSVHGENEVCESSFMNMGRIGHGLLNNAGLVIFGAEKISCLKSMA